MSVLVLEKISKSYNKRNVINDFSMNVDEGEIVSIIGESGAGKTTLLRCINGLEKIDSGNIIINGNPSINKRISKQEKLDVGLVFQDFQLFPHYSVLKNITLPLTKVLKLNNKQAVNRAKALLDNMNLQKRYNAYPCELSGGEKQRVAIARTLATDPKIICFDEPTSALDPKLIIDLIVIIKNLSKEGKTILIVTHDMNFAKDVSDRIVEFSKVS